MTTVGRSLFIFVLITVALMIIPGKAIARVQQNVLILNSYNKGFTWSDDQTEGIVQTFRTLKIDPIIHVEYMDWKYSPTEENLRLLYDHYRLRYANRKIDLIMTTDDAALAFALKHRGELFSGAPVVFSGVMKESATKMLAGQTDVTGVYETFDTEGTVRLMYRFNPELKRIFLAYDDTESGRMTAEPMEQAARRVDPNVSFVHLNTYTISEIIKTLSVLPAGDNSAVLINTYSRDVEGTTMEMERFVKIFSESSKIPVYILYDFDTGFGAVGGSLNGGKRNGEAAARLGAHILAGTKASDLPIVETIATSTVLDYRQLERFGISEEIIPPNASLINRPQSFYEQYKTVVWSTVAVFILMAGFILALINNIRRRVVAEDGLRKSHEELTSLYEEIVASQEELQYQYGELERTQEELAKSQQRYKLSLEGANDGLWDWDIKKHEVYISDRGAELLGLKPREIYDPEKLISKLLLREDYKKAVEALRQHILGKTPYYSCEYRMITPDGVKWMLARGKALTDDSGQRVRMAGSITDITARKNSESTINYLAYHDSLTGLANRAALNEKLMVLTAGGAMASSSGALLFIDLDNFKVINDTFGHSYGDRLLVQIADMLAAVGNGNYFVARMGGDEFVILLEGINDVNEVALCADRVLKRFMNPLQVDEKLFHVTVSIGLTVYPNDGVTAEELFKNADLAMYRAKAQGKNQYVFYNKEMDEVARTKMIMGRSLRDAIANNEFSLWYQPQIIVSNGRIRGFEALLRWNSKDHGLVLPMDFIRLAEETGLIVPLGQWVLREACNFLASLYKAGHTALKVSINISVVELMQSNYVEIVEQAITESGILPGSLGLEITESLLMESFEANIEKLAAIRRLGVEILLDDFGTGYSSLKYLKELPIDVVKIDKSFINDLSTNESTKGLTASIIELAHRIGLKTVAEGVEREEQLEKLRMYHCDMIQGYLFSAPVSEDKIFELLKDFS